MAYEFGTYRTHIGEKYGLKLDAQEKKIFQQMLNAYECATSWLEFQKMTAKTAKNFAMHISRDRIGNKLFNWEDYFLYQIRADLLRNVGIRTGELPGEISDMVIDEV